MEVNNEIEGRSKGKELEGKGAYPEGKQELCLFPGGCKDRADEEQHSRSHEFGFHTITDKSRVLCALWLVPSLS